MRRIGIIGTNGLPAKYGGFETLADYLTQELSMEFSFIVYCPGKKGFRPSALNNAKLKYLPFKANGAQSIIYDICSIFHAWFVCDTLLVLGTPGAFVLPLNILFRKKVIINFGGLEWKRDKWPAIARWYLKFTERIGVKFADCVVADNEVFQQYIYKQYNVNSHLIEYGGDHVTARSISSEILDKYPFLSGSYGISVSRAQPDNNINIILKAYERLPEKSIVIISNWDNFEYGRKLKEQYKGKFKNIILLDAIYDLSVLDVIRSNAELYIHSHSMCGTAPSLVEAMNLRLAVICFNASTNVATTEGKSLYFDNDDDLINIINDLSSEKLEILKADLQEIALRRYTWKIVAGKYRELLS